MARPVQWFYAIHCKKCQAIAPYAGIQTDDPSVEPESKMTGPGSVEVICPRCRHKALYPVSSFEVISMR